MTDCLNFWQLVMKLGKHDRYQVLMCMAMLLKQQDFTVCSYVPLDCTDIDGYTRGCYLFSVIVVIDLTGYCKGMKMKTSIMFH